MQPAISPDENGYVAAGPQPLHPDVVQAKLWPMLIKGVKDKQVFVREASLITLGRVAANPAQRATARKVLIENLRDRNHLVARAAALGLFYVADDTSILPMYEIASDDKTEEDVRAFLALTMTNLGHEMAGGLLRDLADVQELVRRVPLDKSFAGRLPAEHRSEFKKLVDAVFNNAMDNLTEDDKSLPQVDTKFTGRKKDQLGPPP